MKLERISTTEGFAVIGSVRDVQAAQMTLAPGDATGGPDNRHTGADQWLYVVSGGGMAIIEGNEHSLSAGTLLVIERGETHEIRCKGNQPLCTVNFYSPPAYRDDGETLPAGEDQ